MSLGGVALMIAVCSVALVWLLYVLLPAAFRWVSVALVPLGLAYCVYWSPVWFRGADSSEFSSWQLLFIPPWFLAGAIPSALLVKILDKRKSGSNV